MKTFRIILLVITCTVFLLGLFYLFIGLFTGAFEWFSTPAQQERVYIASTTMIVIPIICGVVLFLTRKK